MNIAVASAIVITAFLAAGVLLLISFNKRIRRLQANPPPEFPADRPDAVRATGREQSAGPMPSPGSDGSPPPDAAYDEPYAGEARPPTTG